MHGSSASLGQLQHALDLLQQGQLMQADSLCRQVLANYPQEFHALHMLGIVALQKMDFTHAEHWLRAAIDADPTQASAYSNMAVALLALQRPAEALRYSERGLQLQPDFAQAWINQANALCALQKPLEALESFDRGISLAPTFFDGYFGRANLQLQLRQYPEAIKNYDRALHLNPNHAETFNNCGIALINSNRLEEAVVMFERALQLLPRFVDAWNNRGSALRRLRRHQEAIDSYRQALQIEPRNSTTLTNMANIFLELEILDHALLCCDEALKITSLAPDSLNIRATILRDLHRHDEAAACYTELINVAPNFDYATGNCLFSRSNNLNWSDRSTQIDRILDGIQRSQRASLPFSFLSMSHSAAAQLQCARIFIAERCPTAISTWTGKRSSHERLRIAYVSGDFRDHPVSYLLASTLEQHDQERFETFGISLRPDQASMMGQRIKSTFSQFIDVGRYSNHEIGDLLSKLEIDIAVDLMGYTAGMRPEIFAQRSAPIQVNYLGFPGTMGAPFIDYLIADRFVVPEGLQQHYSECIVYLPDCFQCFDDRRQRTEIGLTRNLVGLPTNGFVFCCFNNSYKLSPEFFDIWMNLLHKTPDSVIWLLGRLESAKENLKMEALRRGISPDRLVFSPRCAYDEYLARLSLADLFLDCLPFNAGATANDALSIGLPVLTVAGEAFAARMAGSLLNTLKLPELITYSLEEYEEKALYLAQHPTELQLLKNRLMENSHKASLFDSDKFCRHLESSYEMMWQRFQQGDKPASFSV